jgi:hypothetical protein
MLEFLVFIIILILIMNIVGKMGASVGNALVEGLFPKKKTIIVVNEHGEEIQIPPKPSKLEVKWQSLSKRDKWAWVLLVLLIVSTFTLEQLGYV